MQNIQNSDAYILMQFREIVKPLKGLPLSELTARMGKLGRPTLDALKANGHDVPTAIGLMREVWRDIERG